MMHFQDPSMLEFQTRLQETKNLNNLKTLFKVQAIPKSTQLRQVVDNIPSGDLEQLFPLLFSPLQRGKHLEAYRFYDGRYLVPLDGTQYFSSGSINCPCCLKKTSSTGKETYYHQALCASIVHPDKRQVIPLASEPIQRIDGNTKQDCELNAGKRIVEKIRKDHPKLRIIIGGDGLYSKQPFVELLKKNGMSFILMAKPKDHKVLFEWISEFKRMNEMGLLEFKDPKGRRQLYEWANDVPLNGRADAVDVDFIEHTIFNEEGKSVYHATWVTDIAVEKDNAVQIAKGGRARWKIENENFNTLKNQGYHAEHNFGHGKKHASYNFFLFILLAFFLHQILELTDRLFQACRMKFSARKEFWNQLRCTVRILVFDSWEHLLEFIKKPP